VLDVVSGWSRRDEVDLVLDSHHAEEIACEGFGLVTLVLPVRADTARDIDDPGAGDFSSNGMNARRTRTGPNTFVS
jgi:hypothetical protein